MTFEQQIPSVIFYLMIWFTYRIIIHEFKNKLNELYQIYRPSYFTTCLNCVWYNLGIIEGFIHFGFFYLTLK